MSRYLTPNHFQILVYLFKNRWEWVSSDKIVGNNKRKYKILRELELLDYVAVQNGHFNRGKPKNYYKIIRNGVKLTRGHVLKWEKLLQN